MGISLKKWLGIRDVQAERRHQTNMATLFKLATAALLLAHLWGLWAFRLTPNIARWEWGLMTAALVWLPLYIGFHAIERHLGTLHYLCAILLLFGAVVVLIGAVWGIAAFVRLGFHENLAPLFGALACLAEIVRCRKHYVHGPMFRRKRRQVQNNPAT